MPDTTFVMHTYFHDMENVIYVFTYIHGKKKGEYKSRVLDCRWFVEFVRVLYAKLLDRNKSLERGVKSEVFLTEAILVMSGLAEIF